MLDASTLLARQQGLATRSQLESTGLTRRALERAVAGGHLVRVRRGLYATGPMPPRGRHLLSGGRRDAGYVAHVRAALLSLGEHAAASGRTAAVLWGFDLAVEPALVELTVGAGCSRCPLPGVRATRARRVDAVRVQVLPGTAPLLVTTPLATVLTCARELPLAQAVAVVDSAMRTGAVSLDELAEAVAARRGRAGWRRLQSVLRWCDPRSGSVLESLLRVLLATHGMTAARTQYVVTEADGRFVARVDLCWPARRLLVEADGRLWHDPDDARTRDRRRGNDYARLGWTVLRFSWSEVVHQPEYVVATVRACLAAAA